MTEDPRIARTREVVLRATVELIASDGPDAVTFQELSRRTRVSRATLYRHWRHADELIFDALADIVSAWDFAGPGPLRDALVREIDGRRRELNQPVVRMAFNAVLSRAPCDPAAAALRDRLVGSIAAGLATRIEAGVDRGELRPGLDAEVLTAQVIGAMVWRSFVMGRDVTRDFIARVVDEALAGWEIG